MTAPQVTVVIPSFNQGRFLDKALSSVFEQQTSVEVFVMDGGSTDDSLAVIRRWEDKLAGWRSHSDKGQSAAINEGIARGTASYVCWLNSDDWFLPDGLSKLCFALEANPDIPVAYGRALNIVEQTSNRYPVMVEPFCEHRMSKRCIISQPATLIRRSAWEAVEGLDESLQMVMDYDLWWRLYRIFGPLLYVDAEVAVNREHDATKTNTPAMRPRYYQEAMMILKKHYGKVPLKWRLSKLYHTGLK